VAAVAGRTFRPPTVRAALPGHDPAAIATALDGLVARDVVAPADAEVGAYTFRHILFRDVAYASLARAERVRLHLAVAAWLEAFAADRLDEFVELLAYHEREAATLAAQSVVPLGVPVDAARAVRYLERAGELASHAGLAGPAIAHLRAALALAPAAEHARLYERLGDCAVMGDAAVEGYRRALELWRTGGAADPLLGARLLRKLLVAYWTWRGSHTVPLDQEESDALHAEALRLAAEAGDEDELWRVRLAPLHAYTRRGTRAERERERDVCAAAVAHFERRGDWPGLWEALDAHAAYLQVLGAYEEAIAASKRCLEWPDLPAWARREAQSMLVKAHFYRCEFDACLSAAWEALAQVRPGDPLGALGEGVDFAIWAAYLSGRWSDLERLRPTQGLIWEEMRQAPGMLRGTTWAGYLPFLWVALAREDRPAADAAAGVLHGMLDPSHPQTPWRRGVVAAYLADDPTRFDLDPMVPRVSDTPGTLEYFTERGLLAPGWLIQKYQADGLDSSHACARVAQALTSGDNAQLAAAIEAAEARHLLPLAARTRIVLAQRTGDRAQLDRARLVLEALGDRQFLRRLEEVAAALTRSAEAG
jgi:hypothetical protein